MLLFMESWTHEGARRDVNGAKLHPYGNISNVFAARSDCRLDPDLRVVMTSRDLNRIVKLPGIDKRRIVTLASDGTLFERSPRLSRVRPAVVQVVTKLRLGVLLDDVASTTHDLLGVSDRRPNVTPHRLREIGKRGELTRHTSPSSQVA
jgi:hypothetical protein